MLSQEVSVKAAGSLQVSQLAEESRVSQEQASLNSRAMLCDWSHGGKCGLSANATWVSRCSYGALGGNFP